MKQWITDLSGLARLRQESVPLPEPQENEVLVKISAVSLNFRDVEGEYWIAWWSYLPYFLQSGLLMRASLHRRLRPPRLNLVSIVRCAMLRHGWDGCEAWPRVLRCHNQ